MGEMVLLFKVSGAITIIVVGGMFVFSVSNNSVDNFFDVMGIKIGGVSQQDLPKEIHDALNDYRINRGLKALAFDSRLASIAQQHSENMASINKATHIISGQDVGDRLRIGNYHCTVKLALGFYSQGGEVILSYQQGSLSAKEIVQMWVDSSDHKEILDARYWKNSGVGVASNNGISFITLDFC